MSLHAACEVLWKHECQP